MTPASRNWLGVWSLVFGMRGYRNIEKRETKRGKTNTEIEGCKMGTVATPYLCILGDASVQRVSKSGACGKYPRKLRKGHEFTYGIFFHACMRRGAGARAEDDCTYVSSTMALSCVIGED